VGVINYNINVLDRLFVQMLHISTNDIGNVTYVHYAWYTVGAMQKLILACRSSHTHQGCHQCRSKQWTTTMWDSDL